MAMAVAAVCCSIVAPVQAEASETVCNHKWEFYRTTSEVLETYRHGHLVGDLLDNNYVDCTVTIKNIYYEYKCKYCPAMIAEPERVVEHSVN